ncbi:hypothetical protein PINS_up001951 [Pythium insidiosum]|nr:hypothetical protein PINS_up001951 [Pythium insidiosum]
MVRPNPNGASDDRIVASITASEPPLDGASVSSGTGNDVDKPVCEEDGVGQHAIIAEVVDESNPADTKEEKIEDVINKIKSMMACETVEVLDSGEILVLPKGWTTRASKTHGGKEYYVSPYGQTQWLRPNMKTGIGYKWVHEIEVTFGPGRLGLNLKQITAGTWCRVHGYPGVHRRNLQAGKRYG